MKGQAMADVWYPLETASFKLRSNTSPRPYKSAALRLRQTKPFTHTHLSLQCKPQTRANMAAAPGAQPPQLDDDPDTPQPGYYMVRMDLVYALDADEKASLDSLPNMETKTHFDIT